MTENRPLLLLALTIGTFNFANDAMLPLIGQKLGLSHPGLETALTSACILVAQITTIPTAILLGTRAGASGLRRLLALACAALALRGLIFATFESPIILVAAQVLDGVATGIWDILLPLILSDFVRRQSAGGWRWPRDEYNARDRPAPPPARRTFERAEECGKGFLIGERFMLTEEPHAAFPMRGHQHGKDKAAEEP